MKNKKSYEVAGIIIAAVILVFLGFFIFKNQATAPSENIENKPVETSQQNDNSNQLANPASVNCEKLGGTLTIKTRGDGGAYGVCEFGEGMACEEWALYKGECPKGGTDASGLDSDIQMYCIWLGGKLDEVNNNTCTLPDGNVCNTQELYDGTCPVN